MINFLDTLLYYLFLFAIAFFSILILSNLGLFFIVSDYAAISYALTFTIFCGLTNSKKQKSFLIDFLWKIWLPRFIFITLISLIYFITLSMLQNSMILMYLIPPVFTPFLFSGLILSMAQSSIALFFQSTLKPNMNDAMHRITHSLYWILLGTTTVFSICCWVLCLKGNCIKYIKSNG